MIGAGLIDNLLYKYIHPVKVEISSNSVFVQVYDNDPDGEGWYDLYEVELSDVLEDMLIEQEYFDYDKSKEMAEIFRKYADKLEIAGEEYALRKQAQKKAQAKR